MFLMSKHSNHRTVQVKYQPGTMIWQMNELLQQSIIDHVHLFPERLWRLQ